MPTGFRGIFRDDDLARAVYSEAAGIARAMPTAVAVPADAEDVAALVKWAAATRTALVPRGSGSSMAGGAVGNGVVVDLSRLNHLGRIDEAAQTVWADPGVLWSTLDVAARRRGLRLPVDPSSGSFCTLGGMVSTNAAGARSLRYGAMRMWVNALDCVFSDGDRATITRGEEPPRRVEPIRRFLREGHAAVVSSDTRHPARHKDVRKESSGYGIHQYADKADLIELLVGSEGTLAIIVGVQLRLAPVPAATSSVLGSFGSLGDASVAAGKAVEVGASACELLDRTFLGYAATAP
ncbi:MAG TPA: FAD-binding oxidoreductase, partial [Gemmatimonadaceae bacterium]|nr:FAD-binding oxidoreductase [Gemmatimonadaceae bacterium]